jgi:hypothetical protein
LFPVEVLSLSKISDVVLYRIYCADFGMDVSGRKLPDCAYVVGVPCREFEFGFQRPVCSGYHVDDSYYENGGSGLFRCPLLPSWVRDGYHDCVFYGGVLHGEHR